MEKMISDWLDQGFSTLLPPAAFPRNSESALVDRFQLGQHYL